MALHSPSLAVAHTGSQGLGPRSCSSSICACVCVSFVSESINSVMGPFTGGKQERILKPQPNYTSLRQNILPSSSLPSLLKSSVHSSSVPVPALVSECTPSGSDLVLLPVLGCNPTIFPLLDWAVGYCTL